MDGSMNRGPSNYFLILCDVIIVLLTLLTYSDWWYYVQHTDFFIKNFICMHLSDNCNLLIIISFISYLFLCWVAGIFILFALYDFIPQLFLLTSSLVVSLPIYSSSCTGILKTLFIRLYFHLVWVFIHFIWDLFICI